LRRVRQELLIRLIIKSISGQSGQRNYDTAVIICLTVFSILQFTGVNARDQTPATGNEWAWYPMIVSHIGATNGPINDGVPTLTQGLFGISKDAAPDHSAMSDASERMLDKRSD